MNVKAKKVRRGIGMPTEGMREDYLTNEGGKGTKGRRNGRRG
jgi:hypothetical protein